jgi:hypothetical protein
LYFIEQEKIRVSFNGSEGFIAFDSSFLRVTVLSQVNDIANASMVKSTTV